MCFSGVLAEIDFSYGENKLRAHTTRVDHYKLKLLFKKRHQRFLPNFTKQYNDLKLFKHYSMSL